VSAPPGRAALETRALDVPFGARAGLRAVTLAVGAGERLALVGPSGAGKTTLLRAIAGLAATSGGQVLVDGRDVTALPPERRDAVYLHQTPVLFPHLSVRANVAFPLRVRARSGPDAGDIVARALAAVRIAELADRLPHQLSGGQRHRAALARAIAARPAALLLDEPLAALDPGLREEVRAAIVDAQQEHPAALVLVTHDLDDAALLADRVAVLLDGALAQVAAPGALFARPASLAVARFLGAYRELPGTVGVDGAFACALGILPAHGAGPHVAGPAVALLRPGDLRVETADARGDAVADAMAGAGRGVARVTAVRHLARTTTVLVHVGGGADAAEGAAALEAQLAPGERLPTVGDVVRVVVARGDVPVFAR
jgi:ABC-type Fe3+/spermidine/putrescine transport system ATPase subunit